MTARIPKYLRCACGHLGNQHSTTTTLCWHPGCQCAGYHHPTVPHAPDNKGTWTNKHRGHQISSHSTRHR